jgi:predicted XRE-type DNA-binding protein
MKSEKLEVVRGSGIVFRDLGHKNADADQFKAILAAEIIKVLDGEGVSVRGAQGRTGIAAADFSRIRNADLGRFTEDRLMSIINRLGSQVEVKIKVRRAETVERIVTIVSLCARVFTHSLGKVRNKSATDEGRCGKSFIDATYRRVLCC